TCAKRRLGEREQQRVDVREQRAAPHREPRQHRACGEDDQVDEDDVREGVGHGIRVSGGARWGWKRPRACSRSFSSWETSTLLGVSRKTWLATRCMLPA